jgi:hypothetical protein
VSALKTSIVYYRLNIHYSKGNSGYSRVIKLKNEVKISIYPNPSNQYVQIDIPSTSKGEATICVYDLFGKGLYKTKIETKEGLTQHTITQVDRWRPGMYMLSIDSKKGQQWHKIIVMHSKNGSNYINARSF